MVLIWLGALFEKNFQSFSLSSIKSFLVDQKLDGSLNFDQYRLKKIDFRNCFQTVAFCSLMIKFVEQMFAKSESHPPASFPHLIQFKQIVRHRFGWRLWYKRYFLTCSKKQCSSCSLFEVRSPNISSLRTDHFGNWSTLKCVELLSGLFWRAPFSRKFSQCGIHMLGIGKHRPNRFANAAKESFEKILAVPNGWKFTSREMKLILAIL